MGVGTLIKNYFLKGWTRWSSLNGWQIEWVDATDNGTNTSLAVDGTDGTYGLDGTYKMDGKWTIWAYTVENDVPT